MLILLAKGHELPSTLGRLSSAMFLASSLPSFFSVNTKFGPESAFPMARKMQPSQQRCADGVRKGYADSLKLLVLSVSHESRRDARFSESK
jgi:hypothetical protein